MRCFIAIPIPEEVLQTLVEVQNKLGKSKTKLKLVDPENIHITVRFLGDLSEEDIEATKKLMQKILR